MSMIKLSAAAIVAAPALQIFTDYIALPVWGVPVTTIGAAAAGAGLSLFFGDPIKSRRLLFGQLIAAAMFGASGAVLLADGFALDWATKNLSMFAMIIAALIRWFLPSAIDRVKELIKDFKFSFVKKGGDKP